MIAPVPEEQAEKKVAALYKDLREVFGVRSVPLFFEYMGAFPDYLEYITGQLTVNIRDEAFLRLTSGTGNEINALIEEEMMYEPEIAKWKAANGRHGSMYHFDKEIASIHKTNIALAFVFVALREAVKGWAVAAKRLNTNNEAESLNTDRNEIKAEAFIYESTNNIEQSRSMTHARAGLVKGQKSSIEKSLLAEYMNMCRIHFEKKMQTVEFWQLRVAVEKIILAVLPLLPHVVFSPVNVVIDLSKKHENFPELLHLLSEHFPTYSVQRMLFSGYMSRKI